MRIMSNPVFIYEELKNLRILFLVDWDGNRRITYSCPYNDSRRALA